MLRFMNELKVCDDPRTTFQAILRKPQIKVKNRKERNRSENNDLSLIQRSKNGHPGCNDKKRAFKYEFFIRLKFGAQEMIFIRIMIFRSFHHHYTFSRATACIADRIV